MEFEQATVAAVASALEAARVHQEPFPHVAIEEFLPAEEYARLAAAIPPLEYFNHGKNDTKADLDITAKSAEFMAAPAETQELWGAARTQLFAETIGPILARRLADDVRGKYEFLLGEQLANEVLEAGLTTTNGRIMCRRPGYTLHPHTDPAQFAITCLLYFSSAGDVDSGALSLYRPARAPELLHASTYYPDREEGIEVELEKTIPVRENLFVAFLNGHQSLHGLRVETGTAETSFKRFVYQSHVVARGFHLKKIYPKLDEQFRARWDRHVVAH